jgi:hypothetical protein
LGSPSSKLMFSCSKVGLAYWFIWTYSFLLHVANKTQFMKIPFFSQIKTLAITTIIKHHVGNHVFLWTIIHKFFMWTIKSRSMHSIYLYPFLLISPPKNVVTLDSSRSLRTFKLFGCHL